MMDAKAKISTFIQAGRSHLNAGERMRAGVWALLVLGVAALLVELPFVLSGYRVARTILWLPLLVSVAVATGCYLRFRYSHRRAVQQADRFFELKEGLVSADEHIRKGREEEIHQLQLNHTERQIRKHDPVRLRGGFPRRLFLLSLLLLASSAALLAVDDSLQVKQERQEAAESLALSEELADEIEQALEDVLEKMDPEAAELLEDPTLQKMVEQFSADSDRKAVMRRLSEIDRHLSQMRNRLDTRADETYLQALAEQLRQSRETAALGNALSQRKYKNAAAELEKMQLDSENSAQKQKALSKLSSRIEQAEKSMSSSQSGSRRNAQDMSREIQRMQQEQKKTGQCSSACKSCVNQSISKSCSSMQQLGARKQAQSALEQLRKDLQQCQNKMCGSCDKPGGQQAGQGVDRSRRPLGARSPAIGKREQLSGQLGEGESEKVIEDSTSGTGVSSGSDVEKSTAEYRRQVEAFVQREDIPEEMKHGVKTYFKQIHRQEDE